MYTKFLILATSLSVVMCGYINDIHHHIPQPYAFGYQVKEPHGGQWRQETSDGHKVHGSYGYVDAWGIKRHVDYVADKHGFRAKVKTNEPGTANQHPAHVKFESNAYQPHANTYLFKGHHY